MKRKPGSELSEESAAALEAGLASGATQLTVYLGSFAQYAEQPICKKHGTSKVPHHRSNRPSGVQWTCLECDRDYAAYRRNSGEIRMCIAAQMANPTYRARVNQRRRQRYATDSEYRDHCKAQAARQRKLHKERMLSSSEYRERHRERQRAYQVARRARMKAAREAAREAALTEQVFSENDAVFSELSRR